MFTQSISQPSLKPGDEEIKKKGLVAILEVEKREKHYETCLQLSI